MEIDEKVKTELIKNLYDWLEVSNNRITGIIGELRNQKTVEGIMKIKTDLLLAYIQEIPIMNNCCYFCLWYDSEYDKNDKCAVMHGLYGDDSSDHNQLKKLKQLASNIQDVLNDIYQKKEVTNENPD